MKMKFLFPAMMVFVTALGQDRALNLDKLEIANSSSLSLLDNTASIVTSNAAVKEFNINTENLSQISAEYSLITNPEQLSGLGFYGLGTTTADLKQVTFAKLARPTFSAAFDENDSTSTIAVGVNLNIVTIYSQTRKQLQESYDKFRLSAEALIEKAETDVLRLNPGMSRTDPNFYQKRDELLEQYELESQEFPLVLQRPLLSLDIAAAWSNLFPTNQYNESMMDRRGAWATVTLRPSFFDLYGFVRYIKDDAVYDPLIEGYSNNYEFFDYGTKVLVNFKMFSLAYEYIKREGDGHDFRSVGILQYKMNDNLYLTGGFGKNFERENGEDLVSLFGIRWGFTDNRGGL